ncbi:MAG: hypothetical protein AB1597_00215 [Chloroflexota bacterium]
MRDVWYGDKRDLVKWGALLHIADANNAKRILQIAYFRSLVKWDDLNLIIEGEKKAIPKSVIDHFRDIRNIEDLESRIKVLATEFNDRKQYKQTIIDMINNGLHPCVVFLDPDTGLAPQRSRSTLKHVRDSELRDIWNEMPVDDVLVVYQHQTNRNNLSWIPQKRSQFAKALKLLKRSVKQAKGPKIAKDVVLFYCRKEKEVE